jgi:hypothetical protein
MTSNRSTLGLRCGQPGFVNLSAIRRAARERWLIACFSAVEYWPRVRPPGGSVAGSKIGS